MTAQGIRDNCLSQLRSLWRLVHRLQRVYASFPDASPEEWRKGIRIVAERIKSMSDVALLQMGGSHVALRNMVADQMKVKRCGADGTGGGHRVLDINWG
jgi:hypothetical protein